MENEKKLLVDKLDGITEESKPAEQRTLLEEVKQCKLIYDAEPVCDGKITKRFIDDDRWLDCCEKHLLIFKQFTDLIELGYSSVELKSSTMAQRILWLNKLER
jgi:hypothetical protein